MIIQSAYNDYKRHCAELGFFREVVETTTSEDGAELSRTMCYCNIQGCDRALVKRGCSSQSKVKLMIFAISSFSLTSQRSHLLSALTNARRLRSLSDDRVASLRALSLPHASQAPFYSHTLIATLATRSAAGFFNFYVKTMKWRRRKSIVFCQKTH